MGKLFLGWSALIKNKRYGREWEVNIDTLEFIDMAPEQVEKHLTQKLLANIKPVMADLIDTVVTRATAPLESSVDEAEKEYKEEMQGKGVDPLILKKFRKES